MCFRGIFSRNAHAEVQGGPCGSHLTCTLSLSCAQLFAAPQTGARHAPLSMGFPRQESWSRLPFPPPGAPPDPGIESPSPALAGGFFTTEPPGKPKSHPASEEKDGRARRPPSQPSVKVCLAPKPEIFSNVTLKSSKFEAL